MKLQVNEGYVLINKPYFSRNKQMKKKTTTKNKMWNNTRFIDGGKEGGLIPNPIGKK